MRFEIERIEQVQVRGSDALIGQDLMSPFVWRSAAGELRMLMRVVPPAGDDDRITGRIWYGHSEGDGLHFTMDDAPLITPGPDSLDIRGCEDPTVVPTGQACIVYYTGLDADGAGQMLYASGPDIRSLVKRGVALASSKTEHNTKEATVERTADGQWRLLYEYAWGGQSRVGLAYGREPAGPWDEKPDPFVARPNLWDSWHLSTGPLLMSDADAPVMFYNGADRAARWGIGWVALNRECSMVTDRSVEPLIAPPPHPSGGRDVSFAASAIEEKGKIWLYFSRNDRMLYRATVLRR